MTNKKNHQAKFKKKQNKKKSKKSHSQSKDLECKKCGEYLDIAKRARADYENLKKQTEDWKKDFIKFSNQGLILELLPVLDHFQEALSHVPEPQKTKQWVVGILYIRKQLQNLLKNQGLELIGQIGDQFNPELYEALSEVKSKEYKSGQIVKVVKRAAKLGEKIIRPGQVIVAK